MSCRAKLSILLISVLFIVTLAGSVSASLLVDENFENSSITQYNNSEGGSNSPCLIDTNQPINGSFSLNTTYVATEAHCVRRPQDYSDGTNAINISFPFYATQSGCSLPLAIGLYHNNATGALNGLFGAVLSGSTGCSDLGDWCIKNQPTGLGTNYGKQANITIEYSPNATDTNSTIIRLNVNGTSSDPRSIDRSIQQLDFLSFRSDCPTTKMRIDDIKIFGISTNTVPRLNTSATIPTSPTANQSIFINVTISDTEGESLNWLNFTLGNPSGTLVITNANSTQFTSQSTTSSQEWHSSNFTISRSGRWKWNLSFMDNNSNAVSSLNNFFEIEPAPNITLIKPTGSWGDNTSIRLNFTVTDNDGLSVCWYQLLNASDLTQTLKANTTVSCTSNTNTEVSFGAQFLQIDKNYTMQFFANDSYNNIFNTTTNFTIVSDTTPPFVSITSPSGAVGSRTNINLAYTRTDNFDNGISECSYRISDVNNNNIIANTTLLGCGSTTFSLSNDGTYIAWVMVNDTVGNSNTSNSTFTVNSIQSPPTGGGGGGGGTPSEVKPSQGVEIELTNLFNSRSSRIFISAESEKIWSLKVKNKAGLPQDITFACVESASCQWVSFKPSKIRVLPNEEKEFEVAIQPPDTIRTGEDFAIAILASQSNGLQDTHTITMTTLPKLRAKEILGRNFIGIFNINIGKWKADAQSFPIPNVIFTILIEGLLGYFFFVRKKKFVAGSMFLFLGFVIATLINQGICVVPIFQCVPIGG